MSGALHVVADPDVFGDSERYLGAVERAARALARHAGGVLQLRIKTGDRDLVASACDRALRAGAEVVLNAGIALDEAVALGAHGVHWPEGAIPEVAPPRPASALVGASVHDEAAVRRAERAGARYVIYGPVFDARSSSKRGVGLDALRETARATVLPVIAIGGLSPERARACLAAGAAGVATLSGVMSAPDPEDAIERFVGVLARRDGRDRSR